MLGAKSHGEPEQELKRLLSEAERKVQIEYQPFRELCTAIWRASARCREATVPVIQAASEKERVEREVLIFYEFIYFFLHMTLRQAFGILRKPQMEKLQTYLGQVIAGAAIDSYFHHWPNDLKQKGISDFYEKLNDAEIEYAECTRFQTSATGNDLAVERLKVLLMRLASNVCNLAWKVASRWKEWWS